MPKEGVRLLWRNLNLYDNHIWAAAQMNANTLSG